MFKSKLIPFILLLFLSVKSFGADFMPELTETCGRLTLNVDDRQTAPNLRFTDLRNTNPQPFVTSIYGGSGTLNGQEVNPLIITSQIEALFYKPRAQGKPADVDLDKARSGVIVKIQAMAGADTIEIVSNRNFPGVSYLRQNRTAYLQIVNIQPIDPKDCLPVKEK